MSRIYCRSDRKGWAVDYKAPDGRRIRKTVGSKQKAKLLLNKVELELASGKDPFPRVPGVPLEQFAAEYNEFVKANFAPASADDASRRWRFFQEFNEKHLHRRTLAEITRKDVETYRSAKLKTCCARTAHNYLQGLHAALNKAKEWGYLKENPAKGLVRIKTVEVKTPKFLKKGEIDKLMTAAEGHHLKPLIATGIYAGLRCKELCNLEWQDIDFEQGLIHVRNKEGASVKNHKDRAVPLNKTLRAILEPLAKPEGPCFPNQVGGIYDKDTARRVVDRLYKKAGLAYTGLHVLRHTFASQLVIAGVSIYKVSQWLGHSDVKMTMIYAHLAPQDADIDRI
jgi:integrase